MKLSTKDKILKAAVEMLEKNGIRSVTQNAIAKVVGISQGQLTYHFPKREDLVMALSDATLDSIADFLLSKGPGLRGSSFEKLMSMVLASMKARFHARALTGLIMEADENPAIRERLVAQGEKVRFLIAAGLDLEPDDPEVVVAHASIIGFGMLYLLHGNDAKLEKGFRTSTEVLQQYLQRTKKTKKE